MALMIANALVATKTHLTNGGLYQHIFQDEFFFVIHQNYNINFFAPLILLPCLLFFFLCNFRNSSISTKLPLLCVWAKQQ
jgi:hypothetical protein